MVKMLTQFFDPKANDSKALRYCNIGRGMSLEVLEYLLPLSDPKAMNSELLRDASKTRNEALFDLVFPVSDPVDALNFMKKEKAPPEHYRMIEERLKVVNDKAYLVQQIAQRDMDRVPAVKPRKM